MNRECSGLADYAETHECLEDEFFCSAKMMVKGWFRTFVFSCLSLAVFFSIHGLWKGIPTWFLHSMNFVLSWGVIWLIGLFGGLLLRKFSFPSVIFVCDGTLTIWYHGLEQRTVSLSECQWYIATARSDKKLSAWLPKVSALVMCYPAGRWR